MRYQTNNKRLIHLLSITVFFSLLFVGVAGVTSAQTQIQAPAPAPPDFLTGKAKGSEFCEDPNANEPGVADKGRFKATLFIRVDIGELPSIVMDVTTRDLTVYEGTGIALSKNAKKGFFTWTGNALGIGGQTLTLSGTYKTNQFSGEVVLLKGKFVLTDPSLPCNTTGRFRAKTSPDLPPPPIPDVN